MRALLLAVLLLTAGIAMAAPVEARPGPPAGSCNFATNPCPGGQLYCHWVSLQVPFCIDNPFK